MTGYNPHWGMPKPASSDEPKPEPTPAEAAAAASSNAGSQPSTGSGNVGKPDYSETLRVNWGSGSLATTPTTTSGRISPAQTAIAEASGVTTIGGRDQVTSRPSGTSGEGARRHTPTSKDMTEGYKNFR